MTTPAGQVGLNCPHCGDNLTRTYVARSYPCPGGHRRTRYCNRCHEQNATIEHVVNVRRKSLIIDLESLEPSTGRLIRAMLRELKVPFTNLVD
ncbi:hypothetical protein HRJ34_15715 [Rhizorhabdus wittichii]|uniref:Uncharacterized protein n=1 Tax=Rhizorhabdus wittichii TaxID=160791 RepID=A0A975D027_9SPHN|nr:hypothetical protein [Rhizorhabdus wittichii]QTH19691.1 hypothetical protein HRJ34_15065 [Rhizorhabdus wittichii]QTH19811.1 hypothetical protein HRJ34_15715 [Rhizorhabdus wittichii]